MTVKVSINQLLYYLLYRARLILFIKLEISSWQTLSWSEVEFTDDLLAVHIRQCKHCDRNLKEAACHLQHIREENKDLFNENHHIQESLVENMLILLHDTKLDVNMSVKLTFKWLELYWIWEVILSISMYILSELNEVQLMRIFIKNHLKFFRVRKSWVENIEKVLN